MLKPDESNKIVVIGNEQADPMLIESRNADSISQKQSFQNFKQIKTSNIAVAISKQRHKQRIVIGGGQKSGRALPSKANFKHDSRYA